MRPPPTSDDLQHLLGALVGVLVLPNSDGFPAFLGKPGVSLSVSLDIAPDLLGPVPVVDLVFRAPMNLASVPEASV